MSEEEVQSAPVEEAPVEEAPAEEPKAEEAPAEEPKKAAPACSGECPCEMISKPFQESKFFGEMKKIFLWKEDIMKSLAVFVVVNVFFLLLLCYDFTVVGLLCWIAFFATIAGLCFDILRVIAYFKNEQAESKLASFSFEVPAEWIDGAFEFFGSLFKAFLGVCVNAILVRNVVFSLSMLGGFLVLIYLATKWGICGMLYAAILFCFIWFRLYEDHKEGIDNLWEKIKDLVKKQFEQLKEKINKPKAQ